MNLKPYQRLAPFYSKKWTAFAKGYVTLIDNLSIIHTEATPTVLDVACGTGELAIELSKRGLSVVGLDISEEMISIAQAKSPETKFFVADMRDFNLGMTFNLVTCAFDSINYLLNKEEVVELFHNVNRHTTCRGLFLFDFNTPKLYEDKQQGTVHHSIEGEEFDQILHYDRERMISSTIFQFKDGNCEEHLQRPYKHEEIDEIICLTEFTLERTFINDRFEPPGPDAYKIFYLVKKLG